MLTNLKLRNFRCFDAIECEFSPGVNVIVGPNAQGKTSLLEAACVLLRLQSPRISTLARAIRHERKSFVLDGYFGAYHLQFYFSSQRKKLALDSVEQKSARQYLEVARLVYFSNQDVEIVRGPAERRRKFLDFVASQIDTGYRRNLRGYDRALRSRNHLLKDPRSLWREISAFNAPLTEAGNYLSSARSRLIAAMEPAANQALHAISGSAESLKMEYLRGSEDDFAGSLDAAKTEDLRLRQTTVGPHRDDFALSLNAQSSDFASEGQQRSLALSLQLAQARMLERRAGVPPLLLLDDIFGELDIARRNALLKSLPVDSQKLITTTHLDWLESGCEATIFDLNHGRLSRC